MISPLAASKDLLSSSPCGDDGGDIGAIGFLGGCIIKTSLFNVILFQIFIFIFITRQRYKNDVNGISGIIIVHCIASKVKTAATKEAE